jgi:hypothetical protein
MREAKRSPPEDPPNHAGEAVNDFLPGPRVAGQNPIDEPSVILNRSHAVLVDPEEHLAHRRSEGSLYHESSAVFYPENATNDAW